MVHTFSTFVTPLMRPLLPTILLLAVFGCESPQQPLPLLAEFEIPGSVHCLAFSPQTRFLAAGTKEVMAVDGGQWRGMVRVWDVATRTVKVNLNQQQWVRSIVFSPDDHYFAVGCGSETIDDPKLVEFDASIPKDLVIYNASSFKEKSRVQFKQPVMQVAFSPDSKHLVLTLAGIFWQPGTISILDIPSLKKQATIDDLLHPRPVNALSPDGKLLAVADAKERVDQEELKLFTFPAGKLQSSFPIQWDTQALSFAGDGKTLALGQVDTLLTFWDWQKGTKLEVPEIAKHMRSNIQFAYSADGRWLICYSWTRTRPLKGQYLLWDCRLQKKVALWQDKFCNVKTLAISPDSQILAVGLAMAGRDPGKVRLYQMPK